jgi:hypothetical protein
VYLNANPGSFADEINFFDLNFDCISRSFFKQLTDKVRSKGFQGVKATFLNGFSNQFCYIRIAD